MAEEVDNSPLMESENKESSNILSIPKNEDISEKKKKPFLSNIQIEKRKAIRMYIVLLIYIGISLLCLIIEDKAKDDDFDDTYDDHKAITILFFIASIIVSVLLSGIVCYYDCLIKTHLFGIILILMLNLVNDYALIFAKHKILGGFKEALAPIVVLLAGNLGVFIRVLISQKDFQESMFLYLFNGIFSLVAGFFMYLVKKDFWVVSYSILAFLISVFTIYFSQYKFIFFSGQKTKLQKKSEILMYSLPFELNITICKGIIYVISYVVRIIRACCHCCCGEKEKEKEKQEK